MMSRQIGMAPSGNNQVMERIGMGNDEALMLTAYISSTVLENVRNCIDMKGKLSELKRWRTFGVIDTARK